MDPVAELLWRDAEICAEGDRLAWVKRAIDARLRALSPPAPQSPARLDAAMRYALLAPGKRIRPLLTYLVAAPANPIEIDATLDVACAIEMVHAASLVLDDLPCMDDASLRRRQPATHIVFGQPTAILASVALLSRAYGVVADIDALDAQTRTRLLGVLSRTVGSEGLVAGQELDLSNAARDPEQAARLNWLKTGVLFAASAEMGAILRGLDEERAHAVKTFARHLGLAFQTHDDILDRTAESADTGKDVRQDRGKTNLWSLIGPARANGAREQDVLLAQQALARSGIPADLILAMVRGAFTEPGAKQ